MQDDHNEPPLAGSNADTASVRRIRDYQRQLRRLTTELSLTEARERQAIASDLHDHIGQALAYVSQRVSRLQGNAVFCGMEKDFSDILSVLEQTIRYTRDLTVEISPPVLYELGLPAAIDWLAERTFNRHGLRVSCVQAGEPGEIAEDIKVFLFKAIQELITNVAKHAGASRVTVDTVWHPETIEIKVSDDGRGFDVTTYESGLSDAGCFGLFSIRERLSYVGGSISITAAVGQGTCVKITSPYRIVAVVDHG